MAENIADFFEKFPTRMTPERLGTWRATILMEITGEGGGQWTVGVGDGKMSVKPETAPGTDTTIVVAASDFAEIIAGKMNPQMAFMTGKLKVKGAMPNALKLSGLLTAK
ncbi:MAG: SCP2 sterol-binding domain-containing protein [Acidobacteriota bacterium]